MTAADPPAHLADRLATFAAELRYADLPGEVVAAAKLHLLDLVGTALAAYGIGAGAYAAGAAQELGGDGAATAIGNDRGVPAGVAALANGTAAHAIEFDDTHTASICHISAVVVPAALAMAEVHGRSGRELLAAVVAGIETTARIGADGAPSYMTTGFHPTPVAGVFGATVAAARLRGCTAEETADAIGIAGSFASGLFEYLGDGASTKSVHAGWAAQAGVSAAILAAHGGDGPAAVLEGRFGLYRTCFRIEDPSRLGEDWDLGRRWETPALAFKAYPCCHFIAAAIDATKELRAAGLDRAEIERVTVTVPEPAVPLVLEPRADKLRPRTPFDAKFSLPFTLAALLVHGDVDVETYRPERLADGSVLELAERISYEAGDLPGYPDVLPARVAVTARDGSVVSRLHPSGGPARPPTEAEILDKFRRNASLSLAGADVATLEARLRDIDEAADLGPTLEPLRRARRRD